MAIDQGKKRKSFTDVKKQTPKKQKTLNGEQPRKGAVKRQVPLLLRCLYRQQPDWQHSLRVAARTQARLKDLQCMQWSRTDNKANREG